MTRARRYERLILGLGVALLFTFQALLPLRAATYDRYFTSPDGVRLHYLEAGAGNRRTLVFIPGWTMPGWIFQQQIDYFSKHYHVVALDPRGQGLSGVPAQGYDLDHRGADIGALIGHLHSGKLVLIGWSLGVLDSLGYIHAQGANQLAGLVLIDNSVGELPAPVVRKPAAESKLVAPPPWPVEMSRFVRTMFARSPGDRYLDKLTSDALVTPEWAAKQLLDYQEPRTFWRDTLYTVPAPILYVVTPRLKGQAANVELHDPQAQSVVFTGTGHALFVDAADRFNSTLQTFLSRKIWP